MKFKFLSHTADIKFRAYGRTLSEVFSNSALALTRFLTNEKIRNKKSFEIKVNGGDIESLMYNFLEEIIFLIDSKNFIVSGISNIKIDEKNLTLKCKLNGDSGNDYKILSHIKAVTYSEMFVKKINGRWVSQVVLDI